MATQGPFNMSRRAASAFLRKNSPAQTTIGRLTPELFAMLQQQAAPALGAITQQGLAAGSALGQNVAASIGSLGLGGTGLGAVSRSLGGSLAGMSAARARGDYLQELLKQAFGGAESVQQMETQKYIARVQGDAQRAAAGAGGGFGFGDVLGALGTAGSFLLPGAGPAKKPLPLQFGAGFGAGF